MAERAVEVIAVRDAIVALRPLSTCSDCTGCGGRCNLFHHLAAEHGALELPQADFPRPPLAGEQWQLVLDDRQLLRHANRGYGLVIAGLLSGSMLGVVAADVIGAAPDLPTLLGAAAGTSLAIALSKRAPAAVLQLRPPAAVVGRDFPHG